MLEGPSEHPHATSVLAILGLDSVVDVEALTWDVVTPESRHGIWRISLPADTPGPASYVVKCYHRRVDRFFDHRYRREERALDLLGRFAPGVAPAVLGGSITEAHSAFLVLEDLGDTTLHIELEGSDVDARMRLLANAVDALTVFHRVTDKHSGLFRALCYSSDLDRINAATMRARFDIAMRRCLSLDGAGAKPPAAVRRQFGLEVVAPLLRSERRVIHNSLSPLNLCLSKDGTMRIVDLETVSTGPAELDLAELVAYSDIDLGRGEGRLVTRYLDSQDYARGERDEFRQRLHLAALARSLDYAGTLTLRHLRFAREGLEDLSLGQLNRRWSYLRGAYQRAVKAGLGGPLFEYLRDVARRTPRRE